MKNLTIHPEARMELESAIRWYESRRKGLGQDFNDAVELVLNAIESAPERGWPYGEYRVLPTSRFPYLVYYRETGNAVLILAIAHEKRRPNYWPDR